MKGENNDSIMFETGNFCKKASSDSCMAWGGSRPVRAGSQDSNVTLSYMNRRGYVDDDARGVLGCLACQWRCYICALRGRNVGPGRRASGSGWKDL